MRRTLPGAIIKFFAEEPAQGNLRFLATWIFELQFGNDLIESRNFSVPNCRVLVLLRAGIYAWTGTIPRIEDHQSWPGGFHGAHRVFFQHVRREIFQASTA